MKKILLGLVVILVLGLAGIGGYLYYNGTSLLRQAVVDYGPPVTGTSIALADVTMSPLSGNAALKGLEIGSPSGFKAPYTFKLDTINIDLEPRTLLGEVLVINSITLDAPSVVYEPKGKSSNIEALQANVARYQGPTDPNAKAPGPERIIIRKLHIKQPEIVVFAKGLIGEQSITAKDVVLTDIGVAEGGVEPGQVADIVMAALEPQVKAAIQSKAGKALLNEVLKLDGVKDIVGGDVGKTIKGLFGKKKK